MKNRHRTIFACFAALTLIGFGSLITPKADAQTSNNPGPQAPAGQDDHNEDAITLASLAGPWQMTLTGFTECGTTTMLVTFTLNEYGVSSTTIKGHTSGCGDGVSTGTPFVVQSLNPNGSGTANLSCGPDCGWNLIIQVAKNRQIFNVVDVDPVNPGNYLEGTAIHQ